MIFGRSPFVTLTLLGLTVLLATPPARAANLPRLSGDQTIPPEMRETIKDSPYKSQLADLLHRRKWNEAIALSNRLLDQSLQEVRILDESEPEAATHPLDQWSWRAMIGELYLFDLQPKAALGQFHLIRSGIPKPKVRPELERLEGNTRTRLRAANGLARAYAELGQWPQSIRWLEQATEEDLATQWCGNCAEGVSTYAYIMTGVWKKAVGPPSTAAAQLRKIVNGGFEPKKLQFMLQSGADQYQKKDAASEATLILGEMYLRLGRHSEARALFQKLVKERALSERAYLAASYLERMKAGKPVGI